MDKIVNRSNSSNILGFKDGTETTFEIGKNNNTNELFIKIPVKDARLTEGDTVKLEQHLKGLSFAISKKESRSIVDEVKLKAKIIKQFHRRIDILKVGKYGAHSKEFNKPLSFQIQGLLYRLNWFNISMNPLFSGVDVACAFSITDTNTKILKKFSYAHADNRDINIKDSTTWIPFIAKLYNRSSKDLRTVCKSLLFLHNSEKKINWDNFRNTNITTI